MKKLTSLSLILHFISIGRNVHNVDLRIEVIGVKKSVTGGANGLIETGAVITIAGGTNARA